MNNNYGQSNLRRNSGTQGAQMAEQENYEAQMMTTSSIKKMILKEHG
jgi:hypothetical protein